MITHDPALVAARLERVRNELERVGRPDVRIIAVTKGFGPDAVELIRTMAVEDIGESYAQELEGKTDALGSDTILHFIGRIQRNKVRRIADRVDLWHSVSRVEIAREIGKRRPGAEALIQVRVGGDETKDGVAPGDVERLIDAAEESGVRVRGLMTIGVLRDRTATKNAFQVVDRLAEELGLPERSMGMSGDYIHAVEAGATMIRLGTALFGPRP